MGHKCFDAFIMKCGNCMNKYVIEQNEIIPQKSNMLGSESVCIELQESVRAGPA